ncbi:MAG: hypothetical protein GY830_02210 [Bacteroidetes bacterium]|nr:hypothetical protein [Bacteroidota bacterium]
MKFFLFLIIFGFLISMFAGFGTYIMSQKRNTAAIVNGEKIKVTEFIRIFNILLSNDPSEKTQEQIKTLKQQALQSLMQEKLMLQETSKIGDFVSNTEIRQQISKHPIFQQNGQFSKNLYYKNLKYAIKQTPEKFERETKNKILIEKGKYFIATAIKTTPTEIKLQSDTIGNAKKYKAQKSYVLLNQWFKNQAAVADTKITYEAK